MMYGNENPNEVFVIDGDISKTLTNCATDPDTGARQEYGRMLLYFLRHQPLEEILKNIHGITSTLLMISEDKVPAIRLRLADQIVSVVLQVREHASPDLEYYLYDRLLQILLKYLQDDDYMVKTEASSALHLLLDEGALDKKMLIERACPTILNCTKHYRDTSEESQTVAIVDLMGRIAPVIGGEALELFLDNYIEMCERASQSIRYNCATIFPVMCQVLGTKITDERLIDAFEDMASSFDWKLRKICAENLALVALVCSPECRRDRLTRIVLDLAKDSCSHIVNATFKVLGQFIATFSTPKVTSLAYSQEGELYITNPSDTEFSKHSDPQIVATYNDYLNSADDIPIKSQSIDSSLSKSLSALKVVASPTSTISTSSSSSSLGSASQETIKDNNSDSLSCKQIAKIIHNNIVKINKQIIFVLDMETHKTEEFYRTKPYAETFINNNPREKRLSGALPRLESFDDSNMFNDSSNGCELGAEGDSLNNYMQSNDSTCSDAVVSSSTDMSVAAPSSSVVDGDNNSTKSENETMLNNVASSDLSGKKFRSSIPVIEHFWRKNTPTDLSSIIKNAIVESKKLHQQPLCEKRKLILPPPPPTAAATDIPTPTSEEPSSALAWDDFLSNDHTKSKSTDRLNECQVDEANNLESGSKGTAESDDEAFNEYNSHKFWYITPDVVVENVHTKDISFDEYFIKTRADFKPPNDYNQNIVPVEILEAYVKMVLNDKYAEVNLKCAYDFPAVAFTIGRQNWHILKKLLQYLCDDLDWKVRKTVASFIDVLAVILGKEIATRDLLPIFVGFFKDIDQVKIKAIENFAKFLKFIEFSKHEEIWSNIGVCLRIDSNTNWRIKEDLIQQILIIIRWYDSINRHDYLLFMVSVTDIFLSDKISCVREIGAETMAEIIRICSPKQRKAIINLYLVKKYSLSYTWRRRQTFVYIFYRYICSNRDVTEFVQMVLQDIRKLSYDSVPNIRLLVAKSLVQLINNDSNILTSGDCEHVDIIKMIRRLQVDDDRDVRETAHLVEIPGCAERNSETVTSETISNEPTITTAATATMSSEENSVQTTTNKQEIENEEVAANSSSIVTENNDTESEAAFMISILQRM